MKPGNRYGREYARHAIAGKALLTAALGTFNQARARREASAKARNLPARGPRPEDGQTPVPTRAPTPAGQARHTGRPK